MIEGTEWEILRIQAAVDRCFDEIFRCCINDFDEELKEYVQNIKIQCSKLEELLNNDNKD